MHKIMSATHGRLLLVLALHLILAAVAAQWPILLSFILLRPLLIAWLLVGVPYALPSILCSVPRTRRADDLYIAQARTPSYLSVCALSLSLLLYLTYINMRGRLSVQLLERSDRSPADMFPSTRDWRCVKARSPPGSCTRTHAAYAPSSSIDHAQLRTVHFFVKCVYF